MATPGAEWTLPRLRIDRQGDWFDGDAPVTHHGVLANLRSNLRRDGDGYFIQTRVRIPVEVEDVPWLVTRLERRADELWAILNDDSQEPIDPGTVRLGPDNAPYCAVKGGHFEARFARAAAFQLLSLADYDERTGRGTLRVGRGEYTIVRGEP
jgi:hypothetical protein